MQRRRERIRIGSKKKIAFVCSGGATKAGAFHLGVALALQEHGFKFMGGLARPETVRAPDPMEISTYVGSSAGSIISSYLAAGYSLENIFNSFLGRAARDPIDSIPKVLPRLTYQTLFKIKPISARDHVSQLALIRKLMMNLARGDFESLVQLKWLKATGIFSTAGLEEYLREEVLPSNRFKDYLPELFVIATPLNHSGKMVFGKRDDIVPQSYDQGLRYETKVGISHACASSTALPFVYSPYPIVSEDTLKENYYIDGEIRETLSTHVAMDSGADLVIASYTHQPYHLKKEIGSLTEHGLPAILIQSLYLLIESKIQKHIHHTRASKSAIDSVGQYCRDHALPDKVRQQLQEILERELNVRSNVDAIYIHPNPNDSDTFFGDHFSLNSKRMAEIVKSGFRAAIDTLKRYDFEDREEALKARRSHSAG